MHLFCYPDMHGIKNIGNIATSPTYLKRSVFIGLFFLCLISYCQNLCRILNIAASFSISCSAWFWWGYDLGYCALCSVETLTAVGSGVHQLNIVPCWLPIQTDWSVCSNDRLCLICHTSCKIQDHFSNLLKKFILDSSCQVPVTGLYEFGPFHDQFAEEFGPVFTSSPSTFMLKWYGASCVMLVSILLAVDLGPVQTNSSIMWL